MSEEPALPREALDAAAERLAHFAETFREEVDGLPELGEFLEIASVATPGNSKFTEALPMPLRFKVKSGKRLYKASGPSRAGELNDAAFVEVSDLLHFLAEQSFSVTGRPVSADAFGPLLKASLGSAGRIFADIDPDTITSIVIEPAKRTRKAALGDVIAIPAANGGYHIASLVARNRFGIALGLLKGVRGRPYAGAVGPDEVIARPVYTDDRLIVSGEWPVVGNNERLRELFPAEPEIYHRPGLSPEVGEFGAAEPPDGALRQISREEAEEVGLLDGSYRQSYPCGFLQDLLDEGLASS